MSVFLVGFFMLMVNKTLKAVERVSNNPITDDGQDSFYAHQPERSFAIET